MSKKKKKSSKAGIGGIAVFVLLAVVFVVLYFTGILESLFDYGENENPGTTVETPSETETSGTTETPGETETPSETETLGTTETPSETETPGTTETPSETETPGSTETPGETETPYETDELSIHFLELGNKYTGDCTLIDIGDTEILIDAGSRQNSAGTIVPYVQQYCTDGVLEYVIATHAHQDHIAGFVGSKSNTGVFESFTVGTLIDFPLTNATSSIYNSYCEKRDALIESGTTHYTALECYNNENGASRTYQITDDISFTILYNYYYENKTSDENDYSVCMLLTQGELNFLFTGDLEENGEKYLVQYNDLPRVQLFKGGHHGSYTANTEALLSVIQPEIVAVCCCCGSDEYTDNVENMFPSQAFVDRVGKYTEKIYVTTIVSDNEDGYESMNGNIVVTSDGVTVTVDCSNNNTIFKDTEWFKKNRTWNY